MVEILDAGQQREVNADKVSAGPSQLPHEKRGLVRRRYQRFRSESMSVGVAYQGAVENGAEGRSTQGGNPLNSTGARLQSDVDAEDDLDPAELTFERLRELWLARDDGRWSAAVAEDVDVDLLRRNLELTPNDRFIQLQRMLALYFSRPRER